MTRIPISTLSIVMIVRSVRKALDRGGGERRRRESGRKVKKLDLAWSKF